MGILGLAKIIADIAPGAVKEGEIKNYFGIITNVLNNYFYLRTLKSIMYVNFCRKESRN